MSSRVWLIGTVAVLMVGSAGTYYVLSQTATQPPRSDAIVEVVPARTVTALGRLEPEGEVIKLSVANAADSRVNQLRVEEGDWVKAGDVIAILQGLDKKQAELTAAQKNVAIYQAKLAQIRAGDAKDAEFAAQRAVIQQLEAQLLTETAEGQATIVRVDAELQNAEQNYQRYRQLYQEGAVERATLDNRRETFETVQARLDEAEARLDSTVLTLQARIQEAQAQLAELREVRPVDLSTAQAELDYAIAQVSRIEAELEDYYVRVPVAGQILKINTHVGEQVNTSQGIVELGQTDQMVAIAEVYETDVGLIQPGQRATIISEHGGFAGDIHGTITHVGMQIKKQDVIEDDPAADRDARVVEVKVQIDSEDNATVAGLTNLQVRITVDLGSSDNREALR
ncbi:MAG: HlyD family efflux transporter periplasmic adaptor subunit [Cyanobacteria bacterium P01_D01_bin.14]